MSDDYKLETAIWHEIPNEENAFQADQCFCFGYNLFDDLLNNAKWIDYLFLLISSRRPSRKESILLEKLAIVLANPGIRELSVRASMNAGVAKAPSASVLIAALSVGSGQFCGARELSLTMDLWRRNIRLAQIDLSFAESEEKGIWPVIEHIPGFDPHSIKSAKSVEDCLKGLLEYSSGEHLKWLADQKPKLELESKSALSLIGVLAAAFCDLNLTGEQCEYLFLMLRLPGAAAHAMEQKYLGWRKFPFFADTVTLENPPKKKPLPDIEALVRGYLNEPK